MYDVNGRWSNGSKQKKNMFLVTFYYIQSRECVTDWKGTTIARKCIVMVYLELSITASILEPM